MKHYFHSLQGLRGVAVLLVVFYHLTGIQIRSGTALPLPELLTIGAVGVDIFFLISGFLMMSIARESEHNAASVRRFVAHRVIRIYPLYWLASIPITLLLFFTSAETLARLNLNPDAARNMPDLPLYLLKAMLLLPQVNLPPLMVSWTLIHEVFFYAVFSVLMLLPQRRLNILLSLWAVTTLAFWHYLQPSQYQPVSYLLCNPLTLEFITGCFLAQVLTQRHIPHAQRIQVLGWLCLIGSWLLWTSQHDYEFPIADQRVLFFLLPCTLIMIGALGAEQNPDAWLKHPALRQVGDASYSIYLTHIIFLSIGRKIWQLGNIPDSLLSNVLFWPALLVVTLTGGMLCYHYIEKPLLRGCKQLLKV